MKVILLQELKGKGGEGDVVDVAPGFANNYLFTQRIAIPATEGNLKQLEERRHNIAKREEVRLENANKMKEALEGATVKVAAQVGEEGVLFGSVTAPMIADAIKESTGIEVDKRRVELGQPIKMAGEHEVSISIYRNIKTTVKVLVGSEADLFGQKEAEQNGATSSTPYTYKGKDSSDDVILGDASQKTSKQKRSEAYSEYLGYTDETTSISGVGEGTLFSSDPIESDRGPEYGYSRIRLHKNEEVSPYAQAEDARFAMDPRQKTLIVLAVLVFFIFIAAVILPDSVYNDSHAHYSLALFIEDLTTNFQNLTALFTGQSYYGKMELKISQYIIVAMAGAGLAVTGAMFQGALKNAMASPSTLGVMNGAQAGTIIYVLAGGSTSVVSSGIGYLTFDQWGQQFIGMNIFEYLWTMMGQSFCSLLGALVVVALVLLIAGIAGHGKVSKSALIIAGSVFSTVISSIISLVRYWLTLYGTDEQVDALTNMSTGTISSSFTFLETFIVAIPIIILLVILCRMSTRLNLLAFSDEEARSMGISPQKERNLVILVCTLLTAIIVSFCGSVSFVGFMSPHIARKFVGPDFKYLIPASMVVGAGFCVLSNMFTNMALAGLGMGSITGIIGCISFIASVIHQRRRGDADWV